jgi:hypothetical protein
LNKAGIENWHCFVDAKEQMCVIETSGAMAKNVHFSAMPDSGNFIKRGLI